MRYTQEERVAAYFAWQYSNGASVRISRQDGDLLVADRIAALRIPVDHPLFRESGFNPLPQGDQELVYRFGSEPANLDGLTKLWAEQTSIRNRAFRLSRWCYDLQLQTARVLTPTHGWPVLVDRALCDLVDPGLIVLTRDYAWYEGRIPPGYPVGPVLVADRVSNLVVAILMPLWDQDVAQLTIPPDPRPPAAEALPASAFREAD